jgi:hypothetical protein
VRVVLRLSPVVVVRVTGRPLWRLGGSIRSVTQPVGASAQTAISSAAVSWRAGAGARAHGRPRCQRRQVA